MSSFQPSQIASLPDVVSAVRIDPATRACKPLSEEQVAVAAAAAWPVFEASGVTPGRAADADWELEAWDVAGFPEPGPPNECFANSDVWLAAAEAARGALAERWPELDPIWISLTLDNRERAA